MKITIGIFEDHLIIQKSMVWLFEQTDTKYEILFTVTDKEKLFEALEQRVPDILIVDVIAEGVNGLEIFERLNKHYPQIKSIAFTSLSSPILVENLLFLNVKGYVNKKQAPADLVEAVNTIYNDQLYLPDEYLFLTGKYYQLNPSLLSQREIEIVKYISEELTSAEIAERLSLAVNTVENHRKNIFNKLNVKNSAGLIREASALGYL